MKQPLNKLSQILSSKTYEIHSSPAKKAERDEALRKIKEYFAASDDFYTKFYTLANLLKLSAKKVKNTDFQVEDPFDTLMTVVSFLNIYSHMLLFLQDKSTISPALANLLLSFSIQKYQNTAFSFIGIHITKSGLFSIDKDPFLTALTINNEMVKKLISGLANKTYIKVNAALTDSLNLFPSLPAVTKFNLNSITPGSIVNTST
jgi:hypothetical protein